MYLYIWLALKEEAEEEEEEKCKILAEVGSLCWNSEGELQKLSSRGQKVETLKKPWAPQCKSSEKSLFISRISDGVYLASQVFAVDVGRSNNPCKLSLRVAIPCNHNECEFF